MSNAGALATGLPPARCFDTPAHVPRLRLRLLIVAVVVGVPVLALVLVAWWLAAGLERRIEDAYRHRLPGQLHVGHVAFTGPHEIVATDLSIGEPGQPPLITVARAVAHIRLLDQRLDKLHLDGVHMRLDLRAWQLLNLIIDAERRIPITRAAEPLHILIANGSLEVTGGLRVDAISVDVLSTGPLLAFSAEAKLGAEPLRLRFDTKELDAGARRWVITADEARGRLPEVLDGVVALELLKPIPRWLRLFLPETIDATGTRIERDPQAKAWSGDLSVRWPMHDPDSHGAAKLNADPRRLTLAKMTVDDPSLLRGEGRLDADLDQGTIAVDLDTWQPGPRLPIPAAVPVAALLEALPALSLRAQTRTGQEAIALTLSGANRAATQAKLELAWDQEQSIRVTAAELPLTMAQSFLPNELTANGGQAEEVKLAFSPGGGLRDFYLKARQARFSIRGWSFGPADGQCALVPTAGGGFTLAISLPIGAISYAGSAATGTLTLDLTSVEALLARVRGPARLPDLRGSVGAEISLVSAPELITGTVKQLRLRRVEVPDLVQQVEADLRGTFTWKPLSLSLRGGGQLRGGQVRLPSFWLDLAARTPLFSAEAVITPSIGYAPAAFDITEILVRAADARGEPIEGAYSAQFAGNLTATGTGAVRGVIDHADLGWLATLAPGQDVKLAGEAAMVVSSDFLLGVMQRVDGAFLPLNADLKLGRNFTVTGITGAVRFVLDQVRDAAPTAAPATPKKP